MLEKGKRKREKVEKMMNCVEVCLNPGRAVPSDGVCVCVFVSAAAEVRVERPAGGKTSAKKPPPGSPQRYSFLTRPHFISSEFKDIK